MACVQGHRLTGLRTDGYQALRCPTCGEGIFVLPKSPLPDPGEAPVKLSTAPEPSKPRAVVEDHPVALVDPVMARQGVDEAEAGTDTIEWVEETGEEAAPAEPDAPLTPTGDPFEAAKSELARPTSTYPRPKKSASGPRPIVPAPVVTPPRPPFDFATWARRRRNTLAFAGVALVVVGTVAIRNWRARLADLPRVAERGRVEGLEALDAGKFDTAYQILSEARQAVAELGDAYQGASAIRQGADEAEVIAKQVNSSLEELLDEASRSDPAEWDEQFRKLYKGRTVIVESEVVAIPDSQGEGGYDLRYRVLPGGEGAKPRSVGRLDLNGFKHFDAIKPKLHDIVTFGATLASFKFDGEHETWVVGLGPDSGVIMTHHKALEALGWPAPAGPGVVEEL